MISFKFGVMKNYIIVVLLFLSFSCSDGDLQIETLDFDSVSIQSCNTATISTEIFFKISSDEALIIDLQTGLLKNEVSAEPITSTIPGQSKLIYRVFTDNITANYFCDSVPPATPTVLEEIEASGGTIIITTTTEDSITFSHTIQLDDVILVNALGETIIDLTINDYGTVQTSN